MSVALDYIYQSIKVQDVKIIAGEKGLKNRVRWIHSIEDKYGANILQGEEIVFITGVSISTPDELLELIKLTNTQNASAVVLNIGEHIKDVDIEIIKYCDENSYPIFTMPLDRRGLDVAKIITTKIIDSERTYMEISNALKDAIFLPEHEELYMPILKKVGFKSEWSYIITTIEIESKDSSIHKIEIYAKKVFKFIEANLSYIKSNFFSVYAGQSIIIMFYNKSDKEIEYILKELYLSLDRDFDRLNFYVGIGEHISSLERLYRGYEEAKNVAKVNRLLKNNNVNLRYSELGVYRLLLAIENKDVMKDFYNETIGELEKHDKVNHTDYVDILVRYFENNCKINETANKLYVHRNTVNYKLTCCAS